MSGINKLGGSAPDLSMLEELANRGAGALKQDGRGGFETDSRMTFNSGMRRLFQQEKSSEDTLQNQQTLGAILDYIKANTSEDVYRNILDSRLQMSGDREKGLTVQDRLERGTYVSPKLVNELLQITRREVAEGQEMFGAMNRELDETRRSYENKSHETAKHYLSNNLLGEVERLRDKGIFKDDYTFRQFREYVANNHDEVMSYVDGKGREQAKYGQVLTESDVQRSVNYYVNTTLLTAFEKDQPERQDFKAMSDETIAEGVRARLKQDGLGRDFESRVDSFIEGLLKRKDDEDDEDTTGMKNMSQIWSTLSNRLESEDRTSLSSQELVDLLDPRMLTDMVREHVIRS